MWQSLRLVFCSGNFFGNHVNRALVFDATEGFLSIASLGYASHAFTTELRVHAGGEESGALADASSSNHVVRRLLAAI